MKKLITLLFAAGLVTAVSAQSGGRDRNDYRSYDNGYQSSPYSSNDQYQYEDQYNRNSQWHGQNYRFDRDRRRNARERYEYEMMMRRREAFYHNQRMSYGVHARPSLQLRIGIGGRSRY